MSWSRILIKPGQSFTLKARWMMEQGKWREGKKMQEVWILKEVTQENAISNYFLCLVCHRWVLLSGLICIIVPVNKKRMRLSETIFINSRWELHGASRSSCMLDSIFYLILATVRNRYHKFACLNRVDIAQMRLCTEKLQVYTV